MMWIIPLDQLETEHAAIVGPKAMALNRIMAAGISVPSGVCITREAYDMFIQQTGLDKRILFELGRKRFEDMRWEEIWDASLRIRNMFTTAVFPDDMLDTLHHTCCDRFNGQPLAIRSAALAEDGAGASFAGLHESFVNVCGWDNIIRSIQLVWASLWSDAALLYRNELGLDIRTSAMTVIIQEMVCGTVAGVGFCVDPNNPQQAVIESVFGLNKGLVDGDIEPDRFFLQRSTGEIVSSTAAKHARKVIPVANGSRIIACEEGLGLSLSLDQVSMVYRRMETLEQLFCGPQDVEWTIKDDQLYILQSRPVTALKTGEKGWYLSLHRSLDNLKQLASRIEHEILPGMERDAQIFSQQDLTGLASDELAAEIESRKQIYDKWHGAYWDECIPFAHGMRLFATVYNDMMNPDDPYEFMDVIMPHSLKSMERNHRLQTLSAYLRQHPESIAPNGDIVDDRFKTEVESFIRDWSILPTITGSEKENDRFFISLLREMQSQNQQLPDDRNTAMEKTAAFVAAFSDEDKTYAHELIELAKKSYQMRDDDNIYLGKVEAGLTQALQEAACRLGERFTEDRHSLNPEEIVTALKFPDYVIPIKDPAVVQEERKVLNARQLRGQPAGKGIAKGRARVILSAKDIVTIEKDEILVCDAIDPTMTFCIPLVRAIVERRGGMLIHGAIIAREYGIPCVTGIPNATQLIQTGDELTVDGFYGLVINHTRTV
jgi:phosphohistidine swiveling domain-containing protein